MTSTLAKKHSFDMVFDSQKVFRLILEACAHPTKMVSIREGSDRLFGDNPAMLALAMTLLDNEVSFNTCEDRLLSHEISCLTHARSASIAEADFIFISRIDDLGAAIENARCGTLENPHESATIIIRDTRDKDTPLSELTFSGPGIDTKANVKVSRTIHEALMLRDEQNYEYPQGIDLLFITEKDDLLAIPRLVHLMHSALKEQASLMPFTAPAPLISMGTIDGTESLVGVL